MNKFPFGQTIFAWREHRQLTQKQLAQRAGISRTNLSAVERGKAEVSLRTLRALAHALDVRPGLLVDGVPPGIEMGAQRLDRSMMDRIAAAALTGERLTDPLQDAAAMQLSALTRSRVEADSKGKKFLRAKLQSPRALARTWLGLAANIHPDDLRSLLQRIEDKTRR